MLLNALACYADGAPPPVVATFIDSAVSDADQATYTFSSKSLGTVTADRYIVVAVAYRHSTQAVTGVTVGGVTCTIDAGANIFSSPNGAAIAIAAVPSGATGDIVVTFSGSAAGCGIAWWSVYNLLSATPVDTVETVQASGTTLDLTGLQTVPEGAAFFVAMGQANSRTFTWTVPTERFDETVDGGIGFTHSGADSVTTGANIDETVTASGADAIVGACASFR